MQNPKQKFRQSSIIFQKRGILSENLKTLTSSNYVFNKQVHRNWDLNKIKFPRQPFVDIGKQETWAKFQQKKLNCRVVGACQSFQIFRQNTWFLKNNRALSKFFVWNFALLNQYYQIITKSVHKKNNFLSTMQATLSQVFVQLICKASLIFKLNLESALLIILKERELYESKHVMVECRCFKICDLLSFLICSSTLVLK